MVAALHQQPGSAELDRLFDLLEDDRLRQQIALARVARAAVEGAEVAVRVADVGVVEVPVDDEGDPVGVGLAVPDLVRSATDRDEVARLEQRERFGVGDPLACERLLQDRPDVSKGLSLGHVRNGHATTASRTKRSSGTSSSSPASCASSRNVINPARSRGPKR